MIQWNAELARRLRCREEEKRELAPLIRRLMDLARIARAEGFQALERELPAAADPLLSAGMRLVMEGLSGDALEDILATYLVAEDRSGYPFLASCVVIEGILSLAEADEPALMARKLVAYLGAERAFGALEELEREGALPSSQPPAQAAAKAGQAEAR
jgi:flagellar motor component MotA